MEIARWINWPIIIGIIDVLLVYFLIYKALLLVRGTRAEYVLKGLIIVILVYAVSRSFGFVTLSWILGNFLGSVILVVVVLFQDDLRRALIKVGLVPGFGADNTTAVEFAIKEVSRATMELSSRRIGALMAVRRDVGLEEYYEHAIRIDAQVSYQLLVSIFLPNSPIHDGAVIVERDRITAAGAVLPLTFNPNVSRSYGTRHRAAIGLSERTDAVIIVVSEETGTISLVREGRISKDLNEKTLHNALRRLTVIHSQRKKGRLFNYLRSLVSKKGADAIVLEDVEHKKDFDTDKEDEAGKIVVEID